MLAVPFHRVCSRRIAPPDGEAACDEGTIETQFHFGVVLLLNLAETTNVGFVVPASRGSHKIAVAARPALPRTPCCFFFFPVPAVDQHIALRNGGCIDQERSTYSDSSSGCCSKLRRRNDLTMCTLLARGPLRYKLRVLNSVVV